jgi:hypothetical protein
VAQSALGYMYDTGEGVPQNYVLAYMWYNLAGPSFEDAIKYRNNVAAKMTSAQIAEGQKMSERCLRSKYADCEPLQVARQEAPQIARGEDKGAPPPTPRNEVASTGTGFFVSETGHTITLAVLVILMGVFITLAYLVWKLPTIRQDASPEAKPAAIQPPLARGRFSYAGGTDKLSAARENRHDMMKTNAVQQSVLSVLKAAGFVLLGVAVLLAFAFLVTLWTGGVLWISEKIVWYVWAVADAALWGCLIVLLPLSLFTATRKVSCFGLFGASFVFGLCTWVLGVLTTYEYWGGFGLFVGLVSGIVGVVPVGILASIFHADWTAAISLTAGLMLTYCARLFAIWLANKTDQEESGLAARPEFLST